MICVCCRVRSNLLVFDVRRCVDGLAVKAASFLIVVKCGTGVVLESVKVDDVLLVSVIVIIICVAVVGDKLFVVVLPANRPPKFKVSITNTVGQQQSISKPKIKMKEELKQSN